MKNRLLALREASRIPLYANANALVANQASSAVLGLIYWMLAAHLYHVDTVGASSAVISTLLLLSAIAQLGLGTGMVRFLPRAGTDTRRLILLSYGAVILTSAVFALGFALLGGALELKGVMGRGLLQGTFAVLATVSWSVFYLQDAVLKGLRRAKWVFIDNLLYNLAKIATLVIGATYLARAGIVGSWFLPTPIMIALIGWMIFGVFTRPENIVPAPAGGIRLTLREVATSAGGDHVGSLVAEAAVRLLPLLVVAVLGVAENAYFYQAWLVATPIALFASSMADSFSAEAATNRPSIGRYSRDILRHMALLILPVAAILAIGAPLVLTLFGKTYAAEGTVLLRWLCLSSPLVIFNAWYLAYLRVMGRIKRVVWVQVLAALVLIALSYLLVHPLGVAGVGIAWLVSQTAQAIFGLADARGVLLGHAPVDCGGPDLIDGAIVVAPHLDDAALSCGGGITRLVGAGIPVTVVSVFTADQAPGVPRSPLSRYALATWGSGDGSFSSRRAEDRAAMGVLGARFEHLGQLDVIFRRSKAGEPLYREPISAPAPDDVESLLPRLVAALRDSAVGSTPNATVFCPMAAYGHVDHTLTREAVEQVVDAARITYYDEYPYCARWGTIVADASGPHGWQLHGLALLAAEIDVRIAAIGCYESQLRGLFPSPIERFGAILLRRVPVVGRMWVPRSDVEKSRARMASRVMIDSAGVGGERYCWSPESTTPFPPAPG